MLYLTFLAYEMLDYRMMVEEDQISFRSESLMVNGVEDYSHQIAEMIGLKYGSNFNEAGVTTIFLITGHCLVLENNQDIQFVDGYNM